MTQQPNNVSAAGVLSDEQVQELADWMRFLSIPGLEKRIEFVRALEKAILAAASAQATGQAVQEPIAKNSRCPDCFGAGVYAKALILPEPPDVTCTRCNGRGTLYAAPSPAAREAGDGVTLAAEQRIAIEAAISISADIEAECHDGSFLSDASVQALRALLREAGSR